MTGALRELPRGHGMCLSEEGAGLGCSWLTAEMVELSLGSGPELGLRVESELRPQLGSVPARARAHAGTTVETQPEDGGQIS